jgi:hypothetical protein
VHTLFGEGRGQWGEMTQTMYAHVNKGIIFKKLNHYTFKSLSFMTVI